MRIETAIFLIGAALLGVAIARWKLPKSAIRLSVLSLVILFFWVSCTIGIVYERDSEWVGKKVVFNRPMAYTTNFNKHVVEPKTYDISRKLSPLEKTDTLWFHKYKNGVKDLEYMESGMSYTVINRYRVVQGWLIAPFGGGPYGKYLLKDENGVVSTILENYLEDPKEGYEWNKEFIEEVEYLDDAKRHKWICTLKAAFYQSKTGTRSQESLISNLKTYISHYDGEISELPEGQGDGIAIEGDADAMAFVYSSKAELGIQKIFSDVRCR